MTTKRFCTCPVEVSGFTVHHPQCGDPGWFEADAVATAAEVGA